MHFAMPPRKTSRPPPYAARNQGGISLPPALRNILRSRLRLAIVGVLSLLAILWLRGGSGHRGDLTVKIPKVAIGSGPSVVIVTVIDPKANPAWAQKIKSNREAYAKKHGALPDSPPFRHN